MITNQGTTHRLLGCQPEPLGSYLKALGLLRLVAEQADPGATARWAPDGFVLETSLDDDDLDEFFLTRYQPTPVISPWNNSSGFGPEGKDQLAVIETSTDDRLAPYRSAIAAARRLRAEPWWVDVSGKKDPMKERKILACRSALPDACLPWMDASVVLAGERAAFPPILGTGGNDGRLEFSRNFHEQVLEVLGLRPKPERRAGWLRDALDGTSTSALIGGKSPGQFDGGAAGGPNSGPVTAAEGVLNPWDWVLLIEGSVLFASGVARRLASGTTARAAAPFTVAASAAGYASATDGEASRGELWLPLWERPCRLAEVRRLFSEAKADWLGHHVRSGLDMAKAVAGLGVDRGISSFSRHALVERNGLATVAVPVGRLAVATGPRPELELLAEIDARLARLRAESRLPAEVARTLRDLDRVAFDLVAGRRGPLAALVAASVLDRAVGRSGVARARMPALHLDGDRWVPHLLAHDNRPELRVALSLASARERRDGDRGDSGLRRLLHPQWDKTVYSSALVTGLGDRPVIEVIVDAHARRVVELMGVARRSAAATSGVPTRYALGTAARLADVAALVRGDLDERLLSDMLSACLLLDFRQRVDWGSLAPVSYLTPALCLVGPFYASQPPVGSRSGDTWKSRLAATPLQPDGAWPALLAAGRLEPVLDAATRRLAIAGLRPLSAPSRRRDAASADEAKRLGAALLCPLGRAQRSDLLDHSCPEPLDDPVDAQQGEANGRP